MKASAIQTEKTPAISRKSLQVTSPVFKNNGLIPLQYTCDGMNINPPVDIDNIPEGTQSLAIVVEDPDAPTGRSWVHWVAWNIPAERHIKENYLLKTQGRNDFGEHKYGGPCPAFGPHRYFFRIYALDTLLNLPGASSKKELENAMENHVLGYGELMGKYKRRSEL